MAIKNNDAKIKTAEKEVAEWIFSLIIAVAIALLIHAFVFQIVCVDGSSMYPTLCDSERMAVTMFSYYFSSPERGDIVVTKYPDDERNFVKRVIGLPGETIKIEDGVLYIDGEVFDEPYINEAMNSDFEEYTIPEGQYMVMGDNRNNSTDSRSYGVGALDEDMIVGKAQFVIWPFSSLRTINYYSGYFAD